MRKDNIVDLLQKRRLIKKSSSDLSLLDVVKIWDSVSSYIESYMKQSKVTEILARRCEEKSHRGSILGCEHTWFRNIYIHS